MPRLETITHTPTGTPRPTPLLFLHGAYAGAWLWERHYLPFFAAQGWHASALSFTGHGGSPGREYLNNLSVRSYVGDLAEAIDAMPVKPVVIAHSMGGFVLQKYLEEADLPGAVLLCSVPPHGLMASTLNLMFSQPSLLLDLNRVIGGGRPALESVCAALFHQPIGPDLLEECFLHLQPESMRAIWDMSGFALVQPARMRRPPMLILGAGHDALISPQQVAATGRLLNQTTEIIPNAGHALMLEPDWQAAPQRIAAWLMEHDF